MKGLKKMEALCAALRRTWTTGAGSAARLHRRDGTVGYTVCCGILSNTGMTAEKCIVWKGDDNVYAGPLEPEALAGAIDVSGLCHAEVGAMVLKDRTPSEKLCCGLWTRRCRGCRNAE